MVIRLDPRYPLVWRSPDTIQFGIDRPVLVLPGVTRAQEHVLAALRGGVPHAGAVMLGRKAGGAPDDILAFLHALGPVLETTASDITARATTGAATEIAPQTDRESAPVPVPANVYVDGAGQTADRIRGLLRDLGISTWLTDADPDLAVVVGHYVLEPARHRRWLRRDIPHLPVVFSDGEIRVGPLVEPGSGPCLYCLELDRVDEDPAWPAMACQLLSRDAPTETARASIDVATRVAGLVQDRLAPHRLAPSRPEPSATGLPAHEHTATSLVFDAATGEVRRRVHRPHERCGCRSLPGNVIVLVGSAAAGPLPPSSGQAVAVPA